MSEHDATTRDLLKRSRQIREITRNALMELGLEHVMQEIKEPLPTGLYRVTVRADHGYEHVVNKAMVLATISVDGPHTMVRCLECARIERWPNRTQPTEKCITAAEAMLGKLCPLWADKEDTT